MDSTGICKTPGILQRQWKTWTRFRKDFLGEMVLGFRFSCLSHVLLLEEEKKTALLFTLTDYITEKLIMCIILWKKSIFVTEGNLLRELIKFLIEMENGGNYENNIVFF